MPPGKTAVSWLTQGHTNVRVDYIVVGPVEHGYPDWKEGVNKAYWGVKHMPPPEAPKVYLEMKAGDIVFFHPYLFHGSGENKV